MTKIKNKIQAARGLFFKTKRGSIYHGLLSNNPCNDDNHRDAMSVAAVVEKKSASSTEFSVQAYQTADSGVQMLIKKINSNSSGASLKITHDLNLWATCFV